VADSLDRMRAALRDMPVPGPRDGFVERAIANATRSAAPARAPTSAPPRDRRGFNWWAAGVGAVAATIAWLAFQWLHPWTPSEPSVVLALNESREISLVIDSERNLDGARIHIYVSGSIALNGYEQQREVEWTASLTRGANLLSLPVVAREAGDGRIVAEIEHDGRTRRVSVSMHVVAPAPRGERA
jgi:hypothetical protein